MAKMEKRQKQILIGAGLLAVVLLMAVFAVKDLDISNALYRPDSAFAVFCEAFGWWPAYLPIPILGATWLWQSGPEYRRGTGAFMLIGGFAGMWYGSLHYLAELGLIGSVSAPMILLLCVVCGLFAAGCTSRTPKAGRTRVCFTCKAGILFLIGQLAVINLVKYFWGRWRYFELVQAGGFSRYTPWYHPNGPTGHSSFPSGHTAAACAVFLLLVYVFVSNRKKAVRWATGIFCTLYVVAVAVGRVMMGRHFASDTLAAMVICGLLFYILLRSKWYHKWFYYHKAHQSRDGLKFTG